jgi:ketosteroid isomerase-like protein
MGRKEMIVSKYRFWCVIFFLGILGCIRKMDSQTDLNSLVEAEYSFSAMSATQGIGRAFLTYFADDAIAFRPAPIKARQYYEDNPDIPGLLTWRPVFADVSAAGDMGYTTGPWELRKENLSEVPVGYGHYVSVWKKRDDGTWRIVLDVGNEYEGPDTTVTELILAETSRIGHATNGSVEAEKNRLLTLARSFSKSTESRGIVEYYMDYATDEARFYRQGSFPTADKAMIYGTLIPVEGILELKPIAAEISYSCDLGYTYGIAVLKTPVVKEQAEAYSAYLHIWKKQTDLSWKIVLDFATPVPSSVVMADR